MDNKIEALNTAKEYIPKLIAGIKDGIENIQAGKDKEFFEVAPYIVEGIDWCFNVIVLTREINKQSVDVDNFKEILEEMLSALENGDYILLSDMLEYEILPKLNEWKSAVDACFVN